MGLLSLYARRSGIRPVVSGALLLPIPNRACRRIVSTAFLNDVRDDTTAESPASSTGSDVNGTEDGTKTASKPRHKLLEHAEAFGTLRYAYLVPGDVKGIEAKNVKFEIHGFLGKMVKSLGHGLALFDFTSSEQGPMLLASTTPELTNKVKEINTHSPVTVVGTIRIKDGQDKPPPPGKNGFRPNAAWSLQLTDIEAHNQFPKDIIVSADTKYPPADRHLQIRFDGRTQEVLELKDWLRTQLMIRARKQGFKQYETPILFKSTSEGAREFLVPSRKRGYAYALPQSPQQYKQILMASGVTAYMQFATCFRDEDLRHDRQPEFTQLDMERAFCDGKGMRWMVSDIVLRTMQTLGRNHEKPWASYDPQLPPRIGRQLAPSLKGLGSGIPSLSFDRAMSSFGSDKPDLRVPNKIFQFRDTVETEEFGRKFSRLWNPYIEAWFLGLDSEPSASYKWVRAFMESEAGKEFLNHPDGAPRLRVFNPAQPCCGLSLDRESRNELLGSKLMEGISPGDVVVFQARKRERPYATTQLGKLRPKLWKYAAKSGLIDAKELQKLRFLWVTDFPMFTPDSLDSGPGQGGHAGFSATHHPFTAPRTVHDYELLFKKPLSAKADSYDLVLNGVEIGGGSRRIHIAEVQEFIFRDILKMPEERIDDFDHLLRALRAGCPPHAGFALGFDRFVATLLGDDTTLRDVIPFPKAKSGVDLFAGGPTKVTDEQLAPFGLSLKE